MTAPDVEKIAREALNCLYLEVDKSIADDVKTKVLAWTEALAQARAPLVAACQICGHEWKRHDPEDGKCDAGPPCECGRDLGFIQRRIAELSRAALTGTGEKPK